VPPPGRTKKKYITLVWYNKKKKENTELNYSERKCSASWLYPGLTLVYLVEQRFDCVQAQTHMYPSLVVDDDTALPPLIHGRN